MDLSSFMLAVISKYVSSLLLVFHQCLAHWHVVQALEIASTLGLVYGTLSRKPDCCPAGGVTASGGSLYPIPGPSIHPSVSLSCDLVESGQIRNVNRK